MSGNVTTMIGDMFESKAQTLTNTVNRFIESMQTKNGH